jgi:hypothetical protein
VPQVEPLSLTGCATSSWWPPRPSYTLVPCIHVVRRRLSLCRTGIPICNGTCFEYQVLTVFVTVCDACLRMLRALFNPSVLPDTFETREKYGVPVYVSRSPLLADYVRDVVGSFRDWLAQVCTSMLECERNMCGQIWSRVGSHGSSLAH